MTETMPSPGGRAPLETLHASDLLARPASIRNQSRDGDEPSGDCRQFSPHQGRTIIYHEP
ncbi:hypothetical protein C9J85_03495 [Haloferax sp. wsp5]|nr:hypothetical protein C9J85_03495 [Haloferax sp. wsp5]